MTPTAAPTPTASTRRVDLRDSLTPSDAVLGANLHALARLSPDAADQIQRCGPCSGAEFFFADDGSVSARLGGRLLASAKRPLDEARAFAQRIDVQESGGVVVTGFGLGRHVEALAQRVGRSGLIVVFEPDAPLLRAVLERVDYSECFRAGNVLLVTDPDDAAALSAGLKGLEALIAMGVVMAPHAPSAARIGDLGARFDQMFARVVASVRTNVVTTMMQTETTVRNALMNIEHYAQRAGIDDLHGLCAGLPAVVVSAGPSLERNVRLLAQPGVRERCVIIAVQTALKPLLRAGVRPHFVTALDYHEISRRFYEGLSADDLRGVTLIAEPKANPSILDSFPGAVRCPRDEFLDITLGEDVAGPHAPIQPGATVAHLAYYLARWLGCDPVALIGQDLGFTDGQYYASGAAIHNVWAGELSAFRTLEMMEWERIVRSRAILRVAQDHLGRPVYTDEQMATYLGHFERDFRADAANGLRIIDATEGGVKKAHASSLSLSQFLALHAHPFARTLPDIPAPAPDSLNGASATARAAARLREVRAGVWKIGERSREAARLLGEMLERHADQSRVNRLIEKVEKVRDEAVNTSPAYELVHRFNQTGAFNRARADRAIALEATLAPLERQKRQIERDARNVRWLAEAADALGALLDEAVRALGGAPKRTRDDAAPAPSGGAATSAASATRVAAVIPVVFADGALGAGRGPEAPFRGVPALRGVLDRLSRTKRVRRVVLLSDEPERARAIAGERFGALTIDVERADAAALRCRRGAVRSARLRAASCWRGALGGLTIYDEALAPEAEARAMDALGVDGALVVGADWALLDPALCDAVIERWAEAPERHRVVFTQAPPGLAPCVVDRHVMSELARAAERPNVFASLGGLLGYVPVRPKPDPIAQQICVSVAPEVRDAGARFIPDTDALARALEAALGDDAATDAATTVRLAGAAAAGACVRELVIELCDSPQTARLRIGRGAGDASSAGGSLMTRERFTRVVRELGADAAPFTVTFDGRGDALAHPEWATFVPLARDLGALGVHVRTDLRADADPVDALLACGADVVSVDLLAETAQTYAALTGANDFDRVRERLERLLSGRARSGWLHAPWVAPRLTRCDATYMEVEPFYDRWLLCAGCAVIDPLAAPIENERIAPLDTPRTAAERFGRERIVVRCDGGEA